MNKVYIVQCKKTIMIYGCFDNEKKALKYVNGNKNYHIIKSDVI